MRFARAGAVARLAGVYPGWWVAVGACLSLGLAAGMSFWAFGLFVAPLEAEFGWSRSVIAAATSLTLLVSGCASPLVGRLVDRYQPRAVILIGSVGTAAGYLLLTRIEQLWQLFALLGLVAFFRTWIFYIPFTTLITRWFSRRRATAMGIATSGFGLGGLVFLPLMAEVLSAVGWRVAFAVAALLVVVINGVFLLVTRDEPPARWVDYDVSDGPTSRAPVEGLWQFGDVKAIVRAPVFWLLAAGFAFFFFAQWAFLFHGPQFLEHAGLSSRHAALVFSVSAGLGVLLRLSSGWAIDQVRRFELLAAAVLSIMALALLVLSLGTSAPLLAAFVLLWGIGSGVGPALEPILVGRLFGRKHYGTVYGILDGMDTTVSIPGPYLGGLIFDLTGTYRPVLGLYALAFTAGAAGFLLIARLAAGGAPQQAPPAARQPAPVAL
ncbi:MAG: MFS transporter [Chloroflexota bacterium]